MVIDGQSVRALIDSGSSVTLISKHVMLGRDLSDCLLRLQTMSGVHVCVKKYVRLRSVGSPGSNLELVPVKAYLLDDLPFSVDIVLGLDVLLRQGFTVKA